MLFGIFSIGPGEWVVLGILAVVLFGSRLPKVARDLGKGVTEFKKGLKGIQSEIDDAMDDRQTSHYQDHIDDHEEPTAPRFEPPTSEPREVVAAEKEPAAQVS
jgi:sec-independent protein translocase protein TatA